MEGFYLHPYLDPVGGAALAAALTTWWLGWRLYIILTLFLVSSLMFLLPLFDPAFYRSAMHSWTRLVLPLLQLWTLWKSVSVIRASAFAMEWDRSFVVLHPPIEMPKTLLEVDGHITRLGFHAVGLLGPEGPSKHRGILAVMLSADRRTVGIAHAVKPDALEACWVVFGSKRGNRRIMTSNLPGPFIGAALERTIEFRNSGISRIDELYGFHREKTLKILGEELDTSDEESLITLMQARTAERIDSLAKEGLIASKSGGSRFEFTARGINRYTFDSLRLHIRPVWMVSRAQDF